MVSDHWPPLSIQDFILRFLLDLKPNEVKPCHLPGGWIKKFGQKIFDGGSDGDNSEDKGNGGDIR